MSFNWTDIDNVTSSPPWSLNYSLPELAVVTAILTAMIAVTACGNALVVVALLRFRSLQSVSNTLIGNLAVSDLLLAVVVLPLSTVNECLGRWPLGHVTCHVWLTVDVLCCTASIWNLCMVAVDRCMAVGCPVWYRQKRSVRHAVPYVAAVWIVSAAVSVPPSLLGWSDVYVQVDVDDSDVFQCVLYQSPGYVMFSASASFFFPFTVTVILYIRIFMLLLQRMALTRSLPTVARCRVIGELSTRQLPDGASLTVDHDDSVAVEVKSTSTERTCEVNTHRLTAPSLTACTPLTAQRSVGQPRRRTTMTTSSSGDVDAHGRHSDSAAACYRRDRREIVVSVRMLVIVVVFGGMWIGFFVIYVTRSWCLTCYVPRRLEAFFFWLGYANSSVNPFLYTVFNTDFRRAFKTIFTGCCLRANDI